VFPAHAGMNRAIRYNSRRRWRVPRTRGDEPRCLHASIMIGTLLFFVYFATMARDEFGFH